MKAIIRKLPAMLVSVLMVIVSFAQTPDMYPPPVPEPVDKNPLNIILYIVLPIAMVVLFLWYRNWMKKKRRKNN